MSESLQHQQLVRLILKETLAIVGQNNKALIASDAVDGLALPPLTSEGFRPDVYYCFNDVLIIGEKHQRMLSDYIAVLNMNHT